MRLDLDLTLLREARSVSMTRELCVGSLRTLGVTAECAADCELALSEACTNALRHTGGRSSYRVHIWVEQTSCRIEVTDNGPGFAASRPPRSGGPSASAPDADSEGGRGLMMIRAVVDHLEVTSGSGGVVVRMEKELSFRDPQPHDQRPPPVGTVEAEDWARPALPIP